MKKVTAKQKAAKLPPELAAALASPTETSLRLEVARLPPELRKATWLKCLSTGVIGKPLEGAEVLEALVELEELHIWGDLEEAPAALSSLTKLRELRISIARPETAQRIGELTSLEKLDLFVGKFGTPAEFPRWIGRLVNLRGLSLNGPIREVGDELGALQRLEVLELGHGVEAQPRLPDGIAALKRLRKLEMKVASLDARIGDLAALEVLTIRDNSLTTLPPEIGRLDKLTELRLTYCGLTSLPPEIGALANLTTLDVQGNALTTIPPEIGNLTKLTTLEVAQNPLRALPPEIGKLTALEDLKFGGDQRLEAGLATLPPEIGELRALRTLWSSLGRLESLPPEIGRCESLKTLYLSNNRVASVPPEIGQLQKLAWFSLAENPLTELPAEIEGCAALAELDLTGCAFAQPAYDRVVAFKAARGNSYNFKLPRLAIERPAPPTTASAARLGPKVIAALAKQNLVLNSPAEIPPPHMRTMKGGAKHPVPEAMRQLICDVQWPEGVLYKVTFGSWDFHALNFHVGVDLTEYECSYHHPLDGVSDMASGNMLVWDLSDPDPTDPRLYRVDHEGWSEHHPMALGVRLSNLIQKMRPGKS